MIYGKAYSERYKTVAGTALGQALYAARWGLIETFAPKGGLLLDYGCCNGDFILQIPDTAAKVIQPYGYDINPFCGHTVMPTVCALGVDILTMWDVMEHLPDPILPIKQLSPSLLFLTTPNLEAVNGKITEWRHYRPEEHLWYFDRHSLKVILGALGYKQIYIGYEDGQLRNSESPTDILTTVYAKV